MDLIIISEILKKIIPNNKKIALAGLGSFIVEKKQAEIMNKGTIITPPQKFLKFSVLECKNDNILENFYSLQSGKNVIDARADIEKVIKQIRMLLTEKRKCRFPKFGDLAFDENGELIFTVLNNVNIFPDTLIFEDLALKPRDIADISYNEEIDINDIIEQGLEPKLEPEQLVAKQLPVIVEKELEHIDVKDVEPQSVPVSEGVNELSNINEEIKLSEVFEHDNVEDNVRQVEELKVSGGEEVQKLNKEDESNKLSKEEELYNEQIIPESVKRKGGKTIIIILSIFTIIVFAILLIYVFQDSLRPLLEKILYTQQERQILNIS